MNEADKKLALNAFKADWNARYGEQGTSSSTFHEDSVVWLRSWQLATQAAYERAAQACRNPVNYTGGPSSTRASAWKECEMAVLALSQGELEAPENTDGGWFASWELEKNFLLEKIDRLEKKFGELEAPATVTAEGWMPIETAPMNVEILVWARGWKFPCTGERGYEGAPAYNPNDGAEFYPPATHWMPLPAAPKVEG